MNNTTKAQTLASRIALEIFPGEYWTSSQRERLVQLLAEALVEEQPKQDQEWPMLGIY